MPWVEALREDVPDLRVFDAHVHIGWHDPAGLEALEEEAVGQEKVVRHVRPRAEKK